MRPLPTLLFLAATAAAQPPNERSFERYEAATKAALKTHTDEVANPDYTHQANAWLRTALAQTRAKLPPPQLLRPADFVYDGTALLPKSAGGKSTFGAAGLLAVRRVDGKLRFFSDANYGRTVYEFEAPQFAAAGTRPAVVVVKTWGNVYGDWPTRVNGLLWDDAPNGLHWCGGPPYSQNTLSPSVGLTRLIGDQPAPEPARVVGTKGRHWVRGGLARAPDGTLYAGLGGYYSQSAGYSPGPALTRLSDGAAVLGYTLQARCPRPPDYTAEPAPPTNWLGIDPVGGKGWWTAADELGGEEWAGGVLLHRRGWCFWASRGLGYINYRTPNNAQVNAPDGRRTTLYVYDPARLGLGAAPDWFGDFPLLPEYSGWSAGTRIAGIVADPSDENVVYAVQARAYKAGEWFPVLHRYKIASR